MPFRSAVLFFHAPVQLGWVTNRCLDGPDDSNGGAAALPNLCPLAARDQRQMRVFQRRAAMDSYAGSSRHPWVCSQVHIQGGRYIQASWRRVAPSKRSLAGRVRLTKPAGFRQLSSLVGS